MYTACDGGCSVCRQVQSHGSRFGISALSLNDVAHSDRAYHHRHQPTVGIGVALIFAVVWPERERAASGKT